MTVDQQDGAPPQSTLMSVWPHPFLDAIKDAALAVNVIDFDVPDTIVLIHGLWMTPLSWEHWIARYEALGYTVIARSWPGMEGDVDQVRRDSSPYARLEALEIIDYYDGIIRALDRQPIIMGHSFGGLFTQVLLDRGLGAAGVAIAPGSPKGILKLPLSTLRASWPVLHNPLNRNKAVPLTPEQFHYAFTNTLSEEASLEVYERYHVPGVGGVLFEGGTANLRRHSPFRVIWDKADRAPLLLIAGDEDHIIPAGAVESNFEHYDHDSGSQVDYKEYPGRSHYTLGQDGWEEVADYALSWATTSAAARIAV